MARRGQTSRAELVKGRVANLWRRYRFSAEQWWVQYRFQGGCCYFCGRPGGDLESRGPKFGELEPLVYDHEHDPPYRFRGLGHPRCNRLAGIIEKALKDPPAWRPGGVTHRVPQDRVVQLERRAEVRRASAARRRKGERVRPEPGERQTYRYPDADGAATVRLGAEVADTVMAALAELEGGRRGRRTG